MKTCQWHEGCDSPPVRTERFCPLHRKSMLRLMESSGYLQQIPKREPAARLPDAVPIDPAFDIAIEQGNYP